MISIQKLFYVLLSFQRTIFSNYFNALTINKYFLVVRLELDRLKVNSMYLYAFVYLHMCIYEHVVLIGSLST